MITTLLICLGDHYPSDPGYSNVFLSWRNWENWADLPTRCTSLFQLITQTVALEWDICVLTGSSRGEINLWIGTEALLAFCSEPLIENQLLWDTNNKVLAESSRDIDLFSDGSLQPLLFTVQHPALAEQICMQLGRLHKADRPLWKRTKKTFSTFGLRQMKAKQTALCGVKDWRCLVVLLSGWLCKDDHNVLTC